MISNVVREFGQKISGGPTCVNGLVTCALHVRRSARSRRRPHRCPQVTWRGAAPPGPPGRDRRAPGVRRRPRRRRPSPPNAPRGATSSAARCPTRRRARYRRRDAGEGPRRTGGPPSSAFRRRSARRRGRLPGRLGVERQVGPVALEPRGLLLDVRHGRRRGRETAEEGRVVLPRQARGAPAALPVARRRSYQEASEPSVLRHTGLRQRCPRSAAARTASSSMVMPRPGAVRRSM